MTEPSDANTDASGDVSVTKISSDGNGRKETKELGGVKPKPSLLQRIRPVTIFWALLYLTWTGYLIYVCYQISS